MTHCGIYKITNLINNKFYIGKSKHIESRWSEHCRESNIDENRWQANKRHEQTPLHKAIRKYGVHNFIFEILEECSEEELNEKEQYWIDKTDAFFSDNGYNCTMGGDGYKCGGGENAPSSILTQAQVDDIKFFLKQRYTIKEIQKHIPIASPQMITSINYGNSWYDANEHYPISINNGHRKFTTEEALDIKKQYSLGISRKTLAEKYQVAPDTIGNLVHGKSYTEIPVIPQVKKAIKRQPNRTWTDDEVIAFRQLYQQGQFSILKLWEQQGQEGCYAAFYNMIKGITYKDIQEGLTK